MLSKVNEVDSDEHPVMWCSSLERTSSTINFQAAWNKNSQSPLSEFLTDIAALATQNVWVLPNFSLKTNIFLSKGPIFGSIPAVLQSLIVLWCLGHHVG